MANMSSVSVPNMDTFVASFNIHVQAREKSPLRNYSNP